MKNFKLAIVGATGLVGRTVLKVLEEKKLPNFEYTLFASSRSAGKHINFFGKEYPINELLVSSFDSGFDYAIFCAGGDVSKKFAPIAASKGCIVIDNSSYFRMDKDVPLVVPEVNPEEIKNHNGIIANPNCSTIQAATILKPLDMAYGIKRIVYSTYQAVSGAGYKGVMDLINGVNSFEKRAKTNDVTSLLVNNKFDYELKKFNCPIFSNCIPHIDIFLDNGYTKEEEKMINETRKILKNPDIKITATAVRVPVLNSHSECINVEFEKGFELNDLKEILANSPNIVLKDDFENEVYPTTLDTNGQDKVFVGRVRMDYSVDSGVNLWVVADNIRKGAASNAVQILQKLIYFD